MNRVKKLSELDIFIQFHSYLSLSSVFLTIIHPHMQLSTHPAIHPSINQSSNLSVGLSIYRSYHWRIYFKALNQDENIIVFKNCVESGKIITLIWMMLFKDSVENIYLQNMCLGKKKIKTLDRLGHLFSSVSFPIYLSTHHWMIHSKDFDYDEIYLSSENIDRVESFKTLDRLYIFRKCVKSPKIKNSRSICPSNFIHHLSVFSNYWMIFFFQRLCLSRKKKIISENMYRVDKFKNNRLIGRSIYLYLPASLSIYLYVRLSFRSSIHYEAKHPVGHLSIYISMV